MNYVSVHIKLTYIKPTRRIDQPECHSSTENNKVQSGQTLKGNCLTTLMETVIGDKHVQDDKHVYNWNFLQQHSGTSNSWAYVGEAKEKKREGKCILTS